MEDIQRIKKYVDAHQLPERALARYDMRYHEYASLSEMATKSPRDAVILAFHYGQAKGYRAGRKGATA